jgi:hypothetical protein
MPQKIILTEEQHYVVINHMLREMVEVDPAMNEEMIDEGMWEKIKYGLSKLGRYKAGGKIFGKGKIDQEAAAKIQAIIDKKGNEMIKALDAQIKQENPEFPNNEKGAEFLNTIMGISSVYDSIVAATLKQPNEEGYLPIDAANGIINDLRDYVKKFLDVDLTAAYSVVDEAEGNVVELSEDELKQLDENFGLAETKIEESFFDNLGKGVKSFGKNLRYVASNPEECEERAEKILKIANSRGITDPEDLKYLKNLEINNCREEMGLGPLADWDGPSTLASRYEEGVDYSINEDDAANVRKTLQAKRGEGGKDFDSERMKTLKSNKLPLLLAGIGGSMGAFSWLANTEWFKHLFDQPYNYTDTETTTELIQQKSEILNDIKPGEGVYKLLGRVTEHPLNANSKPQELVDALKQIGGGDANKGVDLLCQKGGVMMKPTEAAKGLHDLVNNPNQYKTLNDMFHDGASGTGKLNPNTTLYGTIAGRNLTSILIKMVPQIVTKVAIKTGIKTGTGYLVAKGFGAALGPIGVALLGAGALVKIMRMKGQRQSRAKTLNDLYQSMLNLDGGAGIVEPDGPTIDKNEAQDPKKIEDKGKEEGGKDGGKDGGKGDGKGGDKGTTSNGGFNDDLYNSLLNLFRFVVTSNKKFGAGAEGESGDESNVETNVTTFKKGDKAIYKGRNVTVTIPDVSPGSTQIDADGDGPQKRTYAVKTADLKKPLSEAKYFRDKELVNYLNKNVSPKRVKEFEDFINRIEQIRNKLRNMESGDDKVFNQKLQTFKQNPIILTDFNKMFNISSTNPQAYENLAKFINDIFKTVYTGKFKKGELMDKLAGMGKVGAKNIDEADAQFKRTQIEKDAQDRGKFKKHLMQFMTDAIGLFQYMFQQKKNMGAKGGQQQNTDKQAAKLGIKSKPGGKGGSGTGGGAPSGGVAPTATPPSGGDAGDSAPDTSASDTGDDDGSSDSGEPKPFKPATYESVNGQNKILTEEVERIKKIMRSLI